MKISVVIPTYNRHTTIKQTIDSIIENTIKPDEVIIVDQSDNDKTKKNISKYKNKINIIYIKVNIKSASSARNKGWKISVGDIIAFTDDDAYVNKEWIENILKTFKNNKYNAGIIGGKIIPIYKEKNPDWKIPRKWEYILPSYDQGNKIEKYKQRSFPACVNYAIRRDLLVRYYGFNKQLGPKASSSMQLSCEETELAWKVLRSEYNLIYNPFCIAYHPVPKSRQNQEWLENKLFEQGASITYVKKNIFYNSKLGNAILILQIAFRYVILYLEKMLIRKDIFNIKKSFLRGNMYMMSKILRK